MFSACLCDGFLPGGCGVDRRAVLGPPVIALAHALGGVVVFPERREQILIGDLFGVETHEHDFGMAGPAAANFPVGRIGVVAAGIAHGGAVHALQSPEQAFGAPKAAHSENRPLGPRRKRLANPILVHKMPHDHSLKPVTQSRMIAHSLVSARDWYSRHSARSEAQNDGRGTSLRVKWR